MTPGPGAFPLPQLQGRPMVTDGGLETDLIFHHGVDLPHFAAFPLLDSDRGRALLAGYYDGYAAIARRAGAGLVLESPTWRANPGWGARLGYSPAELTRANTSAIALLARLRDRYAAGLTEIVLSGMVGPQDDGYPPGRSPSPGEAASYHRPQIEAFATAGADMVSALTLTSTGEAIGIVQAARAAGLPVTISFTVETDGRLAGGLSLAQAISEVDGHAGPDYFMVNCAHPTHIALALAEPGLWRQRIRGLRYNASAKSHAELDQATGLDEGNPRLLADQHAQLAPLLPPVPVLGGCCGTDTRHVAALWAAGQQPGRGTP
ncbi:MAG TPA: homocysteine S-methyltransferase family protein [Streptosporangiaceae bacterium]|nr:homocysteine S-methyltransferase family protein [Streptosporangiaceae bacterium]